MNRFIIQRWIDIAILTFIALTTSALLESPGRELVQLLRTKVTKSDALIVWITILLTTAFFSILVQHFGASLRHMRFAHRYPPTWIAVILAILIELVAARFSFRHSFYASSDWLTGLLGLVICSIVAGAYKSMVMKKDGLRVADDRDDTFSSTLSDFYEIDRWSRLERPSQTEDYFARRIVAQRIASLLAKSAKSDHLISVGLMGPYGSGKSTLINLIEDELNSLRTNADPEIWFCRSSCWGFDDSSAALSHILSQVIAVVGDRIDSLSIRNLPESYSNALSSGNSWSKLIAGALSHDPTYQLDRLKPLLHAANARLVIVVEDVDRNETQLFDPQQIQAMLQRIRGVFGVTFILSAGSTLEGRIDFSKVCDHVESLPSIRWEALSPILEGVRNHCLNEEGIIDPNSGELRKSFAGAYLASPEMLEAIYAGIDPGSIPGSRALLTMLRTPRSLKHAIRHLLRAWKRLAGEIDFDNLLIATTLRCGAPQAFDFLVEHAGTLRQELKEEERFEDAIDRVRRKYQHIWQHIAEEGDFDEGAALELIRYLFPTAMMYLAMEKSNETIALQGVAASASRDYWQRLLAEELAPNELRDQVVLQLIEQSNEGKVANLAQLMVTNDQCPLIWEYFSVRADAQYLLPLASNVIKLLLSRDGAKAHGDDEDLITIWRRSNRRQHELVAPAAWLTEMVRSTLPRSIRLTNDLYYYWASPNNGIVNLSEREEVRREIYGLARTTFTIEDPRALISAIDLDKGFTLYHLVFTPDNRDPESVFTQPSDWSWLGPVLLEAVKLEPNVMVPQIACLVGLYESGSRNTVYRISAEKLEAIFGEGKREAYGALTEDVRTSFDDPQIREFVDEARRQATLWLTQYDQQ